MINVYKSHARRWQNAVRQYALDVWRNRVNDKVQARFDRQADLFSREFRYALEQRYEKKGIKVYRGTIDGKVNEWLARQRGLQETLKVMATERKDKLVADEIERIESDETIDIQERVNKVYALKKDENVYKVFSFAEHFDDKASQIGDDEVFELGREINNAVISQNTDRYFWRVQQDTKVRKTHLMLADKCFLFSDPPTTIDRYGNKHTGNPGTAYGCRCWADLAPAREKVLRHYIVRESKAA
jgi:hypothetical protein